MPPLAAWANNVWNGDIAVANTLYVNIDSGNSLHVGGNITGQYLYLNTYDGGLLVLDGSANVVQYQVQNYYDVLEVDGSLSVPNGHVYNYGTLQGTGTVDTGLYNYRLQLRHADPRYGKRARCS